MPTQPWLASLSVTLLLVSCTAEGEDVATTFFDPTANPSGNPPTSGGDDTEGDSEAEETATPATDDGPDSTSSQTSADTGDSAEAGSSGSPPADEQPANGMYSECASVADCIGLTTCVLVPGSEGGGYCSNTGCGNPGTDCDPNPGATSTAPPDCIDDGTGALVCALSCAGGQSCPGGMDCLAVGVTMVCA